jgi:peptidoglycan/LPS O-acetylase OafA/YrhL
MGGLLRRHYHHQNQPWSQARAFYMDRALRILPQYLCYASLTLAWHLSIGTNSYHLSHAPTASDLVNNLLVVPLNYYMFNGSDHYTLIPPAWSLGAEIQFYLLAPFIMFWPKRMLVIGLLSLGVYLTALSGAINSDWFGYRLLPGTLFFFLLGACMEKLHRQKQTIHSIAMTLGIALLSMATIWILQNRGNLHQPHNFETLLGLIIGIAMLCALAAQPRNRWDDLAGDISYGVFLNHFLIMWVVYSGGVTVGQLPGFLALSTMLAWITQRYLERPITKLQKNLRTHALASRLKSERQPT